MHPEGDPEATRTAVAAAHPAMRIPVEVVTYQPTEFELRVECPEGGWLLVTDRWAAGWRCWVNGIPTPIRVGNLFFRAVPVAAGRNQVRFLYRPWGYPGLLILSWGLLAGVALAAGLRAVRRPSSYRRR